MTVPQPETFFFWKITCGPRGLDPFYLCTLHSIHSTCHSSQPRAFDYDQGFLHALPHDDYRVWTTARMVTRHHRTSTRSESIRGPLRMPTQRDFHHIHDAKPAQDRGQFVAKEVLHTEDHRSIRVCPLDNNGLPLQLNRRRFLLQKTKGENRRSLRDIDWSHDHDSVSIRQCKRVVGVIHWGWH